jgi:hypothetical protein
MDTVFAELKSIPYSNLTVVIDNPLTSPDSLFRTPPPNRMRPQVRRAAGEEVAGGVFINL